MKSTNFTPELLYNEFEGIKMTENEIKNETKKETYAFTPDIQKKIVAMLLQDEKALEEYAKLIKPDYFESVILKDLTTLIYGFFKLYSRAPTEDEFLEELDSFLEKAKKRNKHFPVGEYCNVCLDVLTLSQKGNFDYVKDKTKGFAQFQAVKQAILEAGTERLKKRDYDGMLNQIQKAIAIGKEEEEIELELTMLDTIDPEKVEWLWPNRIPKGKLSLIVGDPGVSKSFLTIFIAAHVTTGKAWPDAPQMDIEKGSVVILNAEDAASDTIRPRADAAGADVTKISILEGTRIAGEVRHFSLLRDIPKLEELLKKNRDIKLILIDPLSAYLSGVDTHRDSDTRGVMAPLSKLAEKYRVTIVAVLHLNKNTAMQSLYRVSGSMAFLAQARASWIVAYDKNVEGRRLFMPLKCNLAINPTALAFKIVENRLVFEGEPVDVKADDVLMDREESPREEAKKFIRDLLKHGEKEAKDIFAFAKEVGIAQKTLKRAKKDLGIESFQKEGKHWWKFPDKSVEDMTAEEVRNYVAEKAAAAKKEEMVKAEEEKSLPERSPERKEKAEEKVLTEKKRIEPEKKKNNKIKDTPEEISPLKKKDPQTP